MGSSVKAYYQQNGSYPTSWTHDIVKTWFTKAVANSTANTNSGPPSALPTSSPGARKGTLAGALAGGIVGGVAAFALIVLFMLYLLRRRRRRAAAAAATAAAARISILGDGYHKAELEDNKKMAPSELSGGYDGPKVVQTTELPPWQEVRELPVERPELSERPESSERSEFSGWRLHGSG